MEMTVLRRLAPALAFIAVVFVSTPRAGAATIWTDWSSATIGASGSATGSVGAVGVTYTGELLGATVDGSSTIWSPGSTYVGGAVTASPGAVGDHLELQGLPGTNTITFATPVANPVFAIWSLGQIAVPATFTFDATPTFQAGGPSSLTGGGPISVVGNVVSGNEGNGVVQFTGTFQSISWVNTPEFFYGVTVGVNGLEAMPEPASVTMLGLGLIGLLAWSRKRR